MNFYLQAILEALLITFSLSTDAFVSGFAYGANQIKIPFLSVMLITLICSSVLAASLFLGVAISPYIPENLAAVVCFILLAAIGLMKLIESIIRAIIKKNNGLEKEFPTFLLKLFNIYANPEEADTNNNKVLSAGEAALLAAALSLDGLATGFGAGLAAESALLIILFSLFTDAFLLTAGRFAGSKVARKIKINLSWLSGLLLIGLAFLKLFI